MLVADGAMAERPQPLPLPRVCLVGPLAPPAGGMANQCALLLRLLRQDGLQLELVQTNAPYRPAWVAQRRVLRAGFRLLPYMRRLWQALGRNDLLHLMAHSGLAWYLFATPAIVLARLRGKPVLLHYHGGNAAVFFARHPWLVQRLLAACTLHVLPSAYLQRLFASLGLAAQVIPNCVDLAHFVPAQGPRRAGLRLLVARHLEPVYDNATAIRAFARVLPWFPTARLLIAGGGSEQQALRALVDQLGLQAAVEFVGARPHADMAALLASAYCLINPSRVDNQPLCILEAFACGVPVLSTRVGGIADLVQDGVTGLLVPAGDDVTMAEQLRRLLADPQLAIRLAQAALARVAQFGWAQLHPLWLQAYRQAVLAAAGSAGAIP